MLKAVSHFFRYTLSSTIFLFPLTDLNSASRIARTGAKRAASFPNMTTTFSRFSWIESAAPAKGAFTAPDGEIMSEGGCFESRTATSFVRLPALTIRHTMCSLHFATSITSRFGPFYRLRFFSRTTRYRRGECIGFRGGWNAENCNQHRVCIITNATMMPSWKYCTLSFTGQRNWKRDYI